MGKLHRSPPFFKVIPLKSLNSQFNQFNPCSHDISITQYFTWKFKFTLNINLLLYPSKPLNFYCRKIVRNFTGVTDNLKSWILEDISYFHHKILLIKIQFHSWHKITILPFKTVKFLFSTFCKVRDVTICINNGNLWLNHYIVKVYHKKSE